MTKIIQNTIQKHSLNNLHILNILWMSLVLIALLFSVRVRADLESMKNRIPQVVELKEKGWIGEKADGLLGVVQNQGNADAIVNAENTDRTQIYNERRGGTDIHTFMKIMGEERIKNEKPGRFIQKSDGQWTKK